MASSSIPAGDHGDPTRRDFLMVATGALGAVGAGIAAWPFINNLNPAADTLALSTVEVNVAPVAGRPGDHREVARQAAVHPPSHARGDQGRRGGAVVGAARSADRQCARHRHRQEGAAGVADHDRRLHPSRLRAARQQSGRSQGRVSAAGSARATARCTTRRDASAKDRRRSTWRSRVTCSRQTLSSASADRPFRDRSRSSQNGLVSRHAAGLQQQGDRLDRSPPADLLVYREGVSHLPDAAEFQLLLEFRRDRHGDAGAHDRDRHRAGDQLHAARDDGLRLGRAHHARRAVRAG